MHFECSTDVELALRRNTVRMRVYQRVEKAVGAVKGEGNRVTDCITETRVEKAYTPMLGKKQIQLLTLDRPGAMSRGPSQCCMCHWLQ